MRRALCLLAASLITAAGLAAAPGIRWLADHSGVEVAGLETSELQKPEALAGRLSVRLDGAAADLPPMLGTTSVVAGSLRFTPRFPLTPGHRYVAEFRFGDGRAPMVSSHDLPPAPAASATVVEHIFPGADTLPENLLKFYLHFSAPMSGGGIYRHIHLRDESGRDVELPFLEIDEELWDREMKRLTLFIDPGRIKREVKPLEDIGPALVAGKRYTLLIDAAWPDANGRPLGEAAEKKIVVGAPDRDPPDPKGWKLTAPDADSRDAVRVSFSEPMDQALALRLITVAGVAGESTLSHGGNEWAFTPATPWAPGPHRLIVQPELEDLAGNSIGKPFEVDIAGTEAERPSPPPVVIKFDVVGRKQ